MRILPSSVPASAGINDRLVEFRRKALHFVHSSRLDNILSKVPSSFVAIVLQDVLSHLQVVYADDVLPLPHAG
jgi:hypothetical protein